MIGRARGKKLQECMEQPPGDMKMITNSRRAFIRYIHRGETFPCIRALNYVLYFLTFNNNCLLLLI